MRLRSLIIRAALFASLILGFSHPTPSQAQQTSFGEGVVGWTTIQLTGPSLVFGTAGQACYQQWVSFSKNWPAPRSQYVGAYPSGNPSIVNCDWTEFGDGRCDGGINSCNSPGPGFVQFKCANGYHPTGFSQCTPDNEDTPPRQCPRFGNPIAAFDGAKAEHVTDFETADGKFLIERFYRSIPQIYGVQAINNTIRGAIGGWRFGFELEVHLQGTGGNAVTLHTPNGIAYDFTRSGAQFVSTAGSNPQGDYALSFVGTAPADWSNIAGAATQWSVKDASNRVWLLQTFNAALNNQQSPNYNIARPVKVTSPGGYVWNFSYDATTGALQSITDSYGRAFGFTWNFLVYPVAPNTWGYIWINQPVSVARIDLPGNQSLRYTYDPDVIAPGSSALEVRRLVKAELFDASGVKIDGTTYQYENATYPDFLTGVTDARNVRYATFAYDARGRAISTSHAGGQDAYSLSYNTPAAGLPNELIRTVTNPLGKAAEFHWNHPANSNLSQQTSAVGQASTNCPSGASGYTYDSNGFVASSTDEEGRATSFVRDSLDRPTSITRGAGTPQASTRSITWSISWKLPTNVVEPGMTTALTIDSSGLVTQILKTDTTTQTVPYSTNGQARSWSYGYDSTGHLTSVDGPLPGGGDTVSYSYNSTGAFQSFTDEVGHVTTATAWNALGQPTSVTDPNGVVTALAYDGRGRVTSISVDTANTPSTTTIEYNPVGQVTKVTQPNGVYETYTYDDARRLTGAGNSAGETINYVRDAMGNATSITYARSGGGTAYQRTQVFDELGRLIRSIGAGSQTQSFGYDRVSNLVSVTDPRSNVFSYGFDSLNRLIQEVDEQGATVNLTRDAKDDITAYQDARSLTTTYVRNGFGEVIQESSPDKGTTIYVRDARGLVTQKTDARGIVTNYVYDNAGRLTHKTYPGYSENWVNWQDFSWDQTQPGNLGQGRLVGISDESGVNWRTFDGKGRIQIDWRTNYPAPALAVNYSYDAAGNIIGMGYPSGRWVSFSRDAAGRISGIVTYRNGSSPGDVVASSVAWNPFGPVSSIAFGHGLVATYTLDTDYRVTRVQVGPSGNLGTTLDRSLSWTGDTVDAIVDNQFPGTSPAFNYGAQTQSFTYTPTRRLAAAAGYYGSLGWSYDANGNRTAESANGVTSAYAYPSGSNQLASVTPSGGSARSFTYDAAGNVLTDTRSGGLGMTFEYDVEGRLSKAHQTNAPSNGAIYAYDSSNHLVSRTVTQATAPTSVTTLYVYDINNHIIAETDTSGATQREYIWLNDIPVAVADNVASGSPVIYYVHADHLGRPARMTAQNWSWIWDVIYSPFGETSYVWANPAKMDIRFPGQWFQLETGLHYNWNRHYDPSIGRYVQSDPMGLTALLSNGPSTYGYVGQNPLAKVDPSGELIFVLPAIPIIAPALGAVGEAALGLSIGGGAAIGLAWLTAPGRVGDSQIEKDYGNYASGERLCNKPPMDRCAWLEENAKNYGPDQVQKTKKMWNCKHSRRSKDRK